MAGTLAVRLLRADREERGRDWKLERAAEKPIGAGGVPATLGAWGKGGGENVGDGEEKYACVGDEKDLVRGDPESERRCASARSSMCFSAGLPGTDRASRLEPRCGTLGSRAGSSHSGAAVLYPGTMDSRVGTEA